MLKDLSLSLDFVPFYDRGVVCGFQVAGSWRVICGLRVAVVWVLHSISSCFHFKSWVVVRYPAMVRCSEGVCPIEAVGFICSEMDFTVVSIVT